MTAADLVAEHDHVLLDFDGPVCAVFGGNLSDHEAADRLKVLVGAALPPVIRKAHDPFDVLRYAASCGPATAQAVESQLRQLEVEAVASAPETPGAADAVRALHLAGFTVTIVSNNAADAVLAFLVMHDLASQVRGISARTRADPTLLKPDPFLIEQAIRSLGAPAHSCVMVGDSVTDIDAAHSAGVAVVGYANKPGKAATFRARGADAVIEHIGQLLRSTAWA